METTRHDSKRRWNLDLEGMPDFAKSMDRVEAWFEGEVLDRAPVRFTAHNAFVANRASSRRWTSQKDKWYDVEFQVESFIDSIQARKFLGETFPVYWPNLGPSFYAALYGAKLAFDEVTSWTEPILGDWNDLTGLTLDRRCEYMRKMEELTDYALSRCEGKFMVGYTDLHPGLDCVAAWRGTQELCMDLYDNPHEVGIAVGKATKDFQEVFDHFDSKLKARKQLSVSWMGIPSFQKMHIPSCDFASMISRSQFEEFYLPELQAEVKPMAHNIFHLDGKDVARHLDMILDIPEIQAIQWVQGVGDDKPIMQWVPLIQKIQSKGKSVVVDLEAGEVEEFVSTVRPKGIFLCMPLDDEDSQRNMLDRLKKWR